MMKFKEIISNPWFIGGCFFLLGLLFYNSQIITQGDYSPGEVKGYYKAGDQINGDKIEAENLTLNKFEQPEIKQKKGISIKDNTIKNSGIGVSMPKSADVEMEGNILINNEKSIEIRDE